jgi:4-hydroxy-3-methylbut-2-en-1-yl diphosphate reductase
MKLKLLKKRLKKKDMRKFEIPVYYKSSLIAKIKERRRNSDPKKKDFSPTVIDLREVRFYLARHFGFCYGVENAIEIAYKTIDENPGKRIFLLSEMIHNPGVNEDLRSRGVSFLMDTYGNNIVDWDELTSDDVVVIPAFGTTIEIEKILKAKGIDPYRYNTTCPFVEKVWNRARQLGEQDYTIIIHGKHYHEETRATFSHTSDKSPSVIIKDIKEAVELAEVILGNKPEEHFYTFFKGKYSEGFDVKKDLLKIGVVNQTTMLAAETESIAAFMRDTMIKKFGMKNIKEHFADTRDTLCYATNDNQDATYELLKTDAEIAVVIGGYNSSNTGHIVELCEQKFKTFFISSAEKISDQQTIKHYDIHTHSEVETRNFLPVNIPARIAVTSGASCPDSIVEEVVRKLASYYKVEIDIDALV